jgi:fructose-1,6-bisphosphatase/inositol monophosphatase family enzyme
VLKILYSETHRPVSVMTAFSKVFEKVMYNRLLRHLNNSIILAEEQCGFRKKFNNQKGNLRII